MEEKLADRLVQVGLRTINDHHREQFKRFGVEAYDIGRWEETAKLRFDDPVYLSVDIDALDPAYAPGVSHREPGGLSTRQVIALIQSVRAPLVGADVVEYNPRNDISNLTALVAAKLVKEIAGMMASKESQAVTSGEDRLPRD
jgi:arginase family enzyme